AHTAVVAVAPRGGGRYGGGDDEEEAAAAAAARIWSCASEFVRGEWLRLAEWAEFLNVGPVQVQVVTVVLDDRRAHTHAWYSYD
uniref:Uncharacterized protein n=1 Tax=Oryza meridionalis TaxID=40149 RepID=A0A0E0DT76_9ORYZ